MLVALTGARGFLGSHTAQALRRAGHDVRALIRAATDRRDHVEPFVREWRVGDQSDPRVLAGLTAGAEAVIHIAIDWEALNQGPVPNFERNLLGSLRLLEAARTAQVKQMLFVSTIDVIDVYHHVLEDRPLDETHPAWPNSIYGALKAAIELHLKAYHAAYGMSTSAWRPATMYGMHQRLERSHWFDLIKRVKEGQTISTDAGGNVVHVQDVAEALALAVGDESVSGEFYNLVDGYISSQDLAEIARALSRSPAKIVDRPGTGPEKRFDTRKAVDFFDRHHNTTALRRGTSGVREYVGAVLARIG